ncbi:TetR/AcrR family transcriptional regulator [Nocardia sp. CA-128927]|uniref:TetR/AcrR family transcriptional regulator n=1 Tax=Nocardia sp. CA-128927 TaxID=3239975 RepID=UPI003D95F066
MTPQDKSIDGRRARGQQRQELLLTTAVDFVRRRGLSALHARSLAAEAGVSPASIVYHFPTRADLIQATCVEAMQRDLATLRQAADDLRARADLRTMPVDDLAEWLLKLVADRQGPGMPMLSFYLEIVRQPELSAVATQWMDDVREITSTVLTEAGAAQPTSSAVLLQATLNGLRLPLLACPDLDPVQTYRADLARLLHWILDR